jgi:hypothetical protein
VQGFPVVTITATGADGTTVGSATVNLGFASVAYFAPLSGQNDQATTGGAVSATSTTTMAVVADQRADGTAGLLLCNLQTGSCTDAWKDPLPSQIYDIAAAADGVTFYATGWEGAPPTQAMLLKIVLAGNALQVTKFVPDFQIASGVRAQGQLVKVDQSGNVYVAVNGDCPASQSSSCVNVGGWVYEFGPDGSDKGNFPVAASFPVFVTGMDVEPQYTLIAFEALSATTGNITSTNLYLYVNGQLQFPAQSGSGAYHARVFMNGTGDQALAGGQCAGSETNLQFCLESAAIENGQINPYLPTFFAVWDGGNPGPVIINLAQNAIPNPWGGGDVLGSLSAVGSADPSGPTDGGLASWPGNPTPGSPTPLLYGLRFDSPHVPGGTVSVLTGGQYWKDANGLWHLALWGNGSDGTACGAAACTKVVVADVIPQQQSQ